MTTKKKTTTKKKPKSIWRTLSVINVNEYTEDKGSGNFKATYLSWSWAWGILMEHYPDATFENHLNQDGYPCFFDHNGNAMVRVTLCIEDKCHTEDFMVTDNSNRAIKNPDSFAINTALKRCLVKCMSYFGLGHYIYAGEDLPPTDEKFDREEAFKIIKSHIENNAESDWEANVLNHFHCDNFEKLRDDELVFVLKRIGTSTNKKEGT